MALRENRARKEIRFTEHSLCRNSGEYAGTPSGRYVFRPRGGSAVAENK